MPQEFMFNNRPLKERRRELRNNPTPAEKIIWYKLSNRRLCGQKFSRQYGVGPYILDFYCPKLRLAIELDGSGHKEEETKLYDRDRDQYLKSLHIMTLRFWNSEVEGEIEQVLEKIRIEIGKITAPQVFPYPS